MKAHELQAKAEALIEALPYMQSFRGKTVVIKYGGSAMEQKEYVERLLRDIVFLEIVGVNPVVVHGGGKAITERMKKEGIKAEFIDGLRVTDQQSISIVEDVLCSVINPEIAARINAFGGRARGFSGKDVFEAEKMWLTKAATGTKVDLGFVGAVTRAHTTEILKCIHEEIVPVVSPIGKGTDGSTYNINADVAAGHLAMAIKAHKIIYVSDVNGIMRDPSQPDSVISTVTTTDIQTLIKDGIIAGGMLPKVESAVKAISNGVEKVHMIDGRIPHALLLEMFTNAGIGTQIVHD